MRRKLTDEDILFIRENRGKYTLKELGDMFERSSGAIQQIWEHGSYRHLPMTDTERKLRRVRYGATLARQRKKEKLT